jgi:hypothetical protein
MAQNIASCGPTSGYSNYHYSALIGKKDSGFSKDKISSGLTTLQKNANGEYDILMVDTRKKIISLVQDGGKIVLLRSGESDATFLHFYPGMVVELYTFWRDSEGRNHYDLIQSKGGDAMPIHKSSVLTGDCESIDFSKITGK